MTQPRREDKDIVYNLCGYYWHESQLSPSFCGWRHKEKEGHWRYLPDPYTDDSFTGALVKAVFPKMALCSWSLVPFINKEGFLKYMIWDWAISKEVLRADHPNTVLIEAYFKIEGEKNGNHT